MSFDPGAGAALASIACGLEGRAMTLRARAATVAASPAHTRWSSLGARAWAEGVAEIRADLLRAADATERVAAMFRAQAAAAGGR